MWSPFKWNASWTGVILFPTRALPLTSVWTVVQTGVVVLWNWKEMRFLLLSRLLRKVVTIGLKIAVMIVYRSPKFSCEVGWWHSTLKKVRKAAAGPGSVKCPAGFPIPCPRRVTAFGSACHDRAPQTAHGHCHGTPPTLLGESFHLSCRPGPCWTAAVWP